MKGIFSKPYSVFWCAVILGSSIWYSTELSFGVIEYELASYFKYLFMVLTALSRLAVFSLQYEKSKRAYIELGLSWLNGVTQTLTGNVFYGIPLFLRASLFLIPFVVTLLVHFRAMWLGFGIWGLIILVLPDLFFSRFRTR